jgi:hypothetical protein
MIEAGLPERTIERRMGQGRWHRALPAVYRIEGAPITWEQELLAACLWAGSGAAASHRSAARLWGLDGTWPTTVEITAPRRSPRNDLIVHRGPASDVVHRGRLPVTSVTRTLLDLCGVIDARSVEAALLDALRRRMTSMRAIRRALDATPRGRRGTKSLRALIQRFGPGMPESVLEARVLNILREAGLPRPALQHHVRSGGRLVARVDFAYPEVKVSCGRTWSGRDG